MVRMFCRTDSVLCPTSTPPGMRQFYLSRWFRRYIHGLSRKSSFGVPQMLVTIRFITADVLFQLVPHNADAGGGIAFREAVFIQFVIPLVYRTGVFQDHNRWTAVFKIVIFTDDRAGVGVRLNIFTVDFSFSIQVPMTPGETQYRYRNG